MVAKLTKQLSRESVYKIAATYRRRDIIILKYKCQSPWRIHYAQLYSKLLLCRGRQLTQIKSGLLILWKKGMPYINVAEAVYFNLGKHT